MDSCPIPRFLKFAIFEKITNCQHASFVVSFKFFARPLHVMNPLPNSPISQNVIFVKPTIIDMPLLSSCLDFCQTFINFYQICHFYKIVICQDAPFCHLISIWPNSWTLHFCRNLPFSYNRHLSSFPSLSPLLSFCQTFDKFLPDPPFSQFANFVKSSTVNIAGLHLTSRRPCWWSRTKASGNQTLFSC